MNASYQPRAVFLLLSIGALSSVIVGCGDGGAAATNSPSGGNGGTASGGNAGGGAAGAAGAPAGRAGASGASTGGSAGGTQGGASGAGQSGPGGTCKIDADCSLAGVEASPAGCLEPFCKTGTCALRAIDADGDGFRTKKCKLLSDGVFIVELGADCDDASKETNPKGWDGPAGDGNPNHCGDGVDQDCSGAEGDAVLANGASCSCTPGDTEKCGQTAGGSPIDYPGGKPAAGSECKLGDRTCVADLLSGGGKWGPCIGAVGPSLEVCNGGTAKDEDCDGQADEADADGKQEYVYDADGDSARASLPNADPSKPRVAFASILACAKPSTTPPECTAAYCGSTPIAECCPPGNWRLANIATRLDCDDFDDAVFPGAPEVCAVASGPLAKNEDDNCNGLVDELPAIGAELWFFDGDDDGFGDGNTTPKTSCASPGAGWKKAIPNTDCDDSNGAIKPGIAESCTTTFDDNCNGSSTDGCACTVESAPQDCGKPGDCVYIKEGSKCVNGVYEACPTPIDKERYCPDADSDKACVLEQCDQFCPSVKGEGGPPVPPLYKKRELCEPLTDCDDAADGVNPGATEICADGIDQNCKLGADEGCGNCTPGQTVACFSGDVATTVFGNSSVCKMGTSTCGPNGSAGPVCSGEVLPASAEACNGKDDTCNGQVDEGFQLDEPCNVNNTDVGACKGGGRWACAPGGGRECKALDANIGQSGYRSDRAPSNPPSWDWNCSGGELEKQWKLGTDYSEDCSFEGYFGQCAKFKTLLACISSPAQRRRFCNFNGTPPPCEARGDLIECRWTGSACEIEKVTPIYMGCR